MCVLFLSSLIWSLYHYATHVMCLYFCSCCLLLIDALIDCRYLSEDILFMPWTQLRMWPYYHTKIPLVINAEPWALDIWHMASLTVLIISVYLSTFLHEAAIYHIMIYTQWGSLGSCGKFHVWAQHGVCVYHISLITSITRTSHETSLTNSGLYKVCFLALMKFEANVRCFNWTPLHFRAILHFLYSGTDKDLEDFYIRNMWPSYSTWGFILNQAVVYKTAVTITWLIETKRPTNLVVI